MNIPLRIITVLMVLLHMGCAITQHPIYTKSDLLDPADICGVWKDANNLKSKKTIAISKSKSSYKTFQITQEDPYTIFYHNCRFVTLGGALFADIETADSNFKSQPIGHLILKCELSHDTCRLYTFQNLSLGYKNIRRTKIHDELNLHFAPMDKKAREEFMFNDEIVTDSTTRLKQILAQHSNDSEVIILKPLMTLVKLK